MKVVRKYVWFSLIQLCLKIKSCFKVFKWLLQMISTRHQRRQSIYFFLFLKIKRDRKSPWKWNQKANFAYLPGWCYLIEKLNWKNFNKNRKKGNSKKPQIAFQSCSTVHLHYHSRAPGHNMVFKIAILSPIKPHLVVSFDQRFSFLMNSS